MAHYSQCPRCNSNLHTGIMSGNIQAGGLTVCTRCGWYESKAQAKARIKSENQTIVAMITTTVAILLVTAHMLSWGAHAFSVPALKVGQWTGMLVKGGYDELAQMCADLGKLVCARDAYIENFRKNRDIEALAKLARLQLRNQETQTAMSTFATYIDAGGKNGEAALLYGQLLEQAGQDSEALRLMELSIEARPDQLPIAATGAIVRILMKQGRYEEARERLTRFHGSAGNAKGYLNTELSQIEQAIKLYRPGSRADKTASKRG
jgi:hypothetical protein